jgi:molybdenum cofactor cytidylyltransferase
VIPTILLAAGSSRRFGAPKLLEEVRGKPLVRHAAEGLLAVAPGELLVVTPPDSRAFRLALDGLPVGIVENSRAHDGMGASIAAGVAALPPRASAVLIALADVPLGTADALPAVVARFRQGGARIVAPRFRGRPGHPVLFARALFPELVSLTGDQGARELLERHHGSVAIVELDRDAPDDVDTPEDLARLRP